MRQGLKRELVEVLALRDVASAVEPDDDLAMQGLGLAPVQLGSPAPALGASQKI